MKRSLNIKTGIFLMLLAIRLVVECCNIRLTLSLLVMLILEYKGNYCRCIFTHMYTTTIEYIEALLSLSSESKISMRFIPKVMHNWLKIDKYVLEKIEVITGLTYYR